MGFYGAETIALDAQGRATERSGAHLASTGSRIARIVTSVPWEGPDADTFRLRSLLVSRQIENTSQQLTAFGTLLREQAAEQDRCSSGRGLPSLPEAFRALLGGLTAMPEGSLLSGADIGVGRLPGGGRAAQRVPRMRWDGRSTRRCSRRSRSRAGPPPAA